MVLLTALYADARGEIFDAPGHAAVGRAGTTDVLLKPEDMIPLPEGSELMFLPGRSALTGEKGNIASLAKSLFAVAAILPVGYTRTHLPAYLAQPDAPKLPLYGYTAVALDQDVMMVAAVKSDDNAKWDPRRYNRPDLARRVAQVSRELSGNRIVEQLARCSLTWHCCTAQNLFYRRWEAGIPASPVCNANCFGCISLQPAECCPSPQSRITFSPTAQEIAAVGTYHLTHAPDAIISFGQGCEGEPSLAYAQITAAMRQIRSKTGRGIININTNAGFTEGIRAIVDAGLDTMRVSMISAIPETYQAYYRGGYTLDDVRQSIIYAKSRGVYVSINMLLYPGLNDQPHEAAAWREFIGQTKLDLVQFRNLNIDPDAFLAIMPSLANPAAGVRNFIYGLKESAPWLETGSFSHYVGKKTL